MSQTTTETIGAERVAEVDRIMREQYEATLAAIDAMSDGRRKAIETLHPVIATDTDPTPNGIIRPLFAKYAGGAA